jgi:AcrR family transcriptional regulator
MPVATVSSQEDFTRQRLLDAGILCVKELGIARTGMRHIAERSGLVRQTVYNYYKSKNELLAAAFEREGVKMALAVQAHILSVEGVAEKFVEGFLFVVEQFPRNPILALVLEPDSSFLNTVGMTYYPFAPFGLLAFREVFECDAVLAAQAEEISEYWTRNALSFLTMLGTTKRSREEMADYVRRRLLPGLHLPGE